MCKNNTKEKFIYKELSYNIIGSVYDVYNEIGPGFKERYYEDAIAKEFDRRKIKYERQLPCKLLYKSDVIGNFRMDFLIEEKIIMELKRGDFYSKQNITQTLQYLKATNLKLALLVNITSRGVRYKRILNIE